MAINYFQPSDYHIYDTDKEIMANETPPQAYLRIISNQCPKALGTYLDLWEKMDQDCKVYALYSDINEEFLTSRAKFKHDLILLSSAMLISYHFVTDRYVIDVVGWDEEAMYPR